MLLKRKGTVRWKLFQYILQCICIFIFLTLSMFAISVFELSRGFNRSWIAEKWCLPQITFSIQSYYPSFLRSIIYQKEFRRVLCLWDRIWMQEICINKQTAWKMNDHKYFADTKIYLKNFPLSSNFVAKFHSL